MKLLFDENLSFKLCARLDDLFPGSSQVRLRGLAQADDLTIWRHAGANDFTLVSLDGDLAERAALAGSPPKVIWLRCGNRSTDLIESLLRNHFEAIVAFETDQTACLELY